jgi:hypothetical protein
MFELEPLPAESWVQIHVGNGLNPACSVFFLLYSKRLPAWSSAPACRGLVQTSPSCRCRSVLMLRTVCIQNTAIWPNHRLATWPSEDRLNLARLCPQNSQGVLLCDFLVLVNLKASYSAIFSWYSKLILHPSYPTSYPMEKLQKSLEDQEVSNPI